MKQRTIQYEFELGDTVYHIANKKPTKGVVIGWLIDPGCVMYRVIWAGSMECQTHYAIELTGEFQKEWTESED